MTWTAIPIQNLDFVDPYAPPITTAPMGDYFAWICDRCGTEDRGEDLIPSSES